MEYFNGLFALDVATTSTLFFLPTCVFLFFPPLPFSKSIVKTRFSPDLKIIFTCFNRAPITGRKTEFRWNRCLRGWDTNGYDSYSRFPPFSFLHAKNGMARYLSFFPPSSSFSVFTGLTDWRSISVINFVPFEVRSTANLHNWAGVVKTLFTRVS